MSTQEEKPDAGHADPTNTRLWGAAQAGHRARHPRNIGRRVARDRGALYPALQRLEERGWISAKWGFHPTIARRGFNSLTAAGWKQLVKETTKWKWLAAAIGRILGSEAKRS